jgi:hypothetical protein
MNRYGICWEIKAKHIADMIEASILGDPMPPLHVSYYLRCQIFSIHSNIYLDKSRWHHFCPCNGWSSKGTTTVDATGNHAGTCGALPALSMRNQRIVNPIIRLEDIDRSRQIRRWQSWAGAISIGLRRHSGFSSYTVVGSKMPFKVSLSSEEEGGQP